MERFTNAAFSFEVTDTAAAAGDGPHGVAILLHGFPQDRRCWDQVASALAGGGGQAFRDILVRTGLDPASADRYAARARDPAALRGLLNWYRALPFSLREPAGPIQVPTMFAWGNRDRFISRAAAELCGRYVTGPYRFTELHGASHWLPEQAADQIAALLAEHFTATP